MTADRVSISNLDSSAFNKVNIHRPTRAASCEPLRGRYRSTSCAYPEIPTDIAATGKGDRGREKEMKLNN